MSLIRRISQGDGAAEENTGADLLGEVCRGGRRKEGMGDCYPVEGRRGAKIRERVSACLTGGAPTKGNNWEEKLDGKRQEGYRGDESREGVAREGDEEIKGAGEGGEMKADKRGDVCPAPLLSHIASPHNGPIRGRHPLFFFFLSDQR